MVEVMMDVAAGCQGQHPTSKLHFPKKLMLLCLGNVTFLGNITYLLDVTPQQPAATSIYHFHLCYSRSKIWLLSNIYPIAIHSGFQATSSTTRCIHVYCDMIASFASEKKGISIMQYYRQAITFVMILCLFTEAVW